jgi:hypothetical protein
MTIPPTEIDVREEIDILSVDPLFIERQRNRYASRAVAYVVWLNGLAALALLLGFAHATIPPDNVKRFADAMLVFGAGTVAGLGSAFFAYVGAPSELSALTWLPGAGLCVGSRSLPRLRARFVSLGP